MPKVGEEEFAYTPEGILEAKLKAEETGFPITNAPDRVEKYQLGGITKPPQVSVSETNIGNPPNQPPPPEIPKPSYRKGGKVKK